ncbi:MAG: hypothetical protein KKB77_08235 [Bacteroidetes bacterium]|nr:hypothetical protein [Bacteroidota bacterium]
MKDGMELDLKNEMGLLRSNYYHQTRSLLHPAISCTETDVFKVNNGVFTFPYNFPFLKENVSHNLIRKLAVINAIYVKCFFEEDNVLDEYHLPPATFRKFICRMCESRNFKTLATGQLVHLCGEKILEYVLEYESKYYSAVISEKLDNDISLENMLDEKNLRFLGFKFLPICVSFAAFCLVENLPEKISTCEELVINFQIGRQLIDDLKDLEKDLQQPDRSYIIKACQRSIERDQPTIIDIENLLLESNFDYEIARTIVRYMQAAEENACKLNFKIFLNQIRLYKHKAKMYERKK